MAKVKKPSSFKPLKLCLCMDARQQKAMHSIHLWQEASKEMNFMLGAPQPPEFERQNELVRLEYQAKLDAFEPDLKPCGRHCCNHPKNK